MNHLPADALPLIQLRTERRSNHPWIFQKMVEKPDPKPKPGTIVDIVDRAGVFAGRGFYNGHSSISLRVLTQDNAEELEEAVLARKSSDAGARRRERRKRETRTEAYRLVQSEGEGWSGLGVDLCSHSFFI